MGDNAIITISQFEDKYAGDVIDIVLRFQNDGTRPIVTVKDQPDLLDITCEYIDKGGNFWVAKDNEKLICTIGISDIFNEKYGRKYQ